MATNYGPDNISTTCFDEFFVIYCTVYIQPFNYDVSWKISYPGLDPVYIKFNRTAELNLLYPHEYGILASLTVYTLATGAIRSELHLPIFNNRSINGTLIQCGNIGNLNETLILPEDVHPIRKFEQMSVLLLFTLTKTGIFHHFCM